MRELIPTHTIQRNRKPLYLCSHLTIFSIYSVVIFFYIISFILFYFDERSIREVPLSDTLAIDIHGQY